MTMPPNTPTTPSRLAWSLGLAGLIPFVALALMAHMADPVHSRSAAAVLAAYGATIVSFLGAIHWGLGMRDPQGPQAPGLVWGVVPSLLGWAALVLQPAHGLLVLALTLVACVLVDHKKYPDHGLRDWLPLRWVLTVVATTCCASAAVRWA